MYPEYMMESLKMVEKTRPKRVEIAKTGKPIVDPLTLKEREEILNKFHPDYKSDARRPVEIGPNKGESLTTKVSEILESHSRINPEDIDLCNIDYDVDVLIIGGGGGGAMAAIWTQKQGVSVLISTKLRLGDSNSMMSQGGMQAAVNPHDNPIIHYLDAIGGGHFENKPELVAAMTMDGPMIAKYLEDLGVMWDKDEKGVLFTKAGGGTSRRRMMSCRDYTGAEIMRTLRDEVRNYPDDIEVLEYTPAIELIMDDKGQIAGALLYQTEREEYIVVRAKTTILATGGYGRLHIQGFATTNHYGATADGLVMAYRAGARLMYMDSVQYHPTGAVFPEQILGFLITEKVRGLGGQPVNRFGELFVFPLEPRDVEASALIQECTERDKGIETPAGRKGIWLDSPIINILSGAGTIEKNLPAMVRQYQRFDIDIMKYPMLVFPTLHYQNGGIEINENGETTLPNLYAAGEQTGGLHGRNRLMGNSVLDYNVFGRRAALHAAAKSKTVKIGKLNFNHVNKYEKELKEAGIETKRIAPILLPDYRNFEVIRKHRKEFDPFLGGGVTGHYGEKCDLE